MTAVSKPNNNPPSAPTMVPFTRAALRFPRRGDEAELNDVASGFSMPGRLADFGAAPNLSRLRAGSLPGLWRYVVRGMSVGARDADRQHLAAVVAVQEWTQCFQQE